MYNNLFENKMKKSIFLVIIIVVFLSGFLFSRSVVANNSTLAFTRLGKVKKVKVLNRYPKRIKLRWKKIKRAKYYQVRVLRKRSNNKYKIVKSVRAKKARNNKMIKKLTSGKRYYFRVRACKKKKCGKWSKHKSARTLGPEIEDDDGEEYEFVLNNLIVDIERYDPVTGRAGAFKFHGGLEYVFLEFGHVTDEGKTLPTFEYIVDSSANVYAPMDGVIGRVDYQTDSSDYEITMNVDDNTQQMTIGFDHILNPQVVVGQFVSTGDVIGNPGTHSWDGYGRVELEIYGDNYMHCPFEYFNADLNNEYQQKVWDLMDDWEDFRGMDNLYDQAAMQNYAAGCLAWKY